MQTIIEILNDWRPMWLCGLVLGMVGLMVRLLKDTIDDFRRS